MKGLGFHKPDREPGNEVGISLVEEYKMVGYSVFPSAKRPKARFRRRTFHEPNLIN